MSVPVAPDPRATDPRATDPPANDTGGTDRLAADPLAPLREAILRSAQRDAEAEVGEAQAHRRHVLDEARAQADRIRAQARAEGERDAEQLRLEQRARSRRRARASVLAEQSRALNDLRREVSRRLAALWSSDDTREPIRRRLVQAATADLGDGVAIRDLPEGGIVATTPHARATYRLADLADQAIASLDTELRGLWTP